jgi:hypothetical protein
MGLLESVIENLLDNALRHGGPNGRVRLQRPEAGSVPSSSNIQDQGPGFGDLDIQSFELLRPEGFGDRRGLGLAIVDASAAPSGFPAGTVQRSRGRRPRFVFAVYGDLSRNAASFASARSDSSASGNIPWMPLLPSTICVTRRSQARLQVT